MVGAKTVKPSFRRKERIINSKENQIIVVNIHEPIIDIETFNKCQQMKEKFKKTRVRKYDEAVINYIILCAQ